MAVPDRSNVGMDTELTEQYVLNRTFDPEFNVMAVELLGYDAGANGLRRITVDSGGAVADPTMAVRIDTSSTPGMTYIGKAVIGADPSAAVWQIARLDTSSGLIKTWASADSLYTHVWDDRTVLSYE